MKNSILVLFFISIVFNANAQLYSNIDTATAFNEGLSGIKKGNSWAFISTDGTLVIDFRNDFVETSNMPPAFNDGLCLIKETREGITYFGYLGTNGEVVIPAEYLVASPFENGRASVIKLYKTDTGGTNALGKTIVTYSYNEMIIDTENKTVFLVKGPINLSLSQLLKKQNIPAISSTFLNKDLISVKQSDNTVSIYRLGNE